MAIRGKKNVTVLIKKMSENKIAKNWQIATLVKSELVSSEVKALTFKLENWHAHYAGQHYDIRLTAANGYQAERSYSVASPPEQAGEVEFGVQLLADGEVSPFLWQLKLAEQIEVRGPIGGHFVWNHEMPGPLVLIGGGSGLVPLMAMIRHWQANLISTLSTEKTEREGREVFLIASARTPEQIVYKTELAALARANENFKLTQIITSQAKRLDAAKLQEILGPVLVQMPAIYICGSTKFVEAIANALVSLQVNPHLIKTERFG